MKAYIGVAVAVLYADNHVADNGHTGPVTKKFLVRGLCIVLLRLNELVVKVNVILPPSSTALWTTGNSGAMC